VLPLVSLNVKRTVPFTGLLLASVTLTVTRLVLSTMVFVAFTLMLVPIGSGVNVLLVLLALYTSVSLNSASISTGLPVNGV